MPHKPVERTLLSYGLNADFRVFSIQYPLPPSPLSTYLASDTARCLNIITVIIIVIIIIIIIILFSSRLFLGLLSHDSAASRKMWAVPRMANNCARPKLSGRLNLPYQAFFILGDSVPITMGSTVTFVTMDSFTFESWYLSTFSPSVVRIFWSTWPSYVNVCHFCVALCTTVISGQLCISSLSVKTLLSQIILLSLLCIWDGLMV